MDYNITLPYPPSVNHYKGQTKTGRHFLTKHARLYRDTVKERCVTVPKFIDSFIKIEVVCYLPDRRKRDLTNIDKCLLDALQYAEVFNDDFYVDKISYERARDLEGNLIISKNNGFLEIHISDLPNLTMFKGLDHEKRIKNNSI